MKATSLIFLVVFPLTLMAEEVKIGDSLDQVRIALGEPRGRAQMGSRELLSFERGEVELNAQVVTRVALRSEEAQTAFATKRAATESRVREEQETRRTRLTAEGETLKATKLADKTFQSAPIRIQLEYWRNFAVQYPSVSCAEQLNLARAQFYAEEHAELVQAEEAQQAAALKDNVSNPRIFYPVYSTDSYGYGRQYSVLRRQERLDRDYYNRTLDSGRGRQDASWRNERDPRFQPSRHDRSRGRTDTRDCNPSTSGTSWRNNGNGRPRNAATNHSLLAAGQDAMAWDGTKMPGGEAAGLFR